MILPDINLLIYAYNSGAPQHSGARLWLEKLLNSKEPVALSWVVMMGFIRIATHQRILTKPMTATQACDITKSWLARPNVCQISPGRRHAGIFFGLLEDLGVAGNLTTDAHIAALGIEYQAEVHTTDADFSRFRGLSWVNPLRSRPQEQ